MELRQDLSFQLTARMLANQQKRFWACVPQVFVENATFVTRSLMLFSPHMCLQIRPTHKGPAKSADGSTVGQPLHPVAGVFAVAADTRAEV